MVMKIDNAYSAAMINRSKLTTKLNPGDLETLLQNAVQEPPTQFRTSSFGFSNKHDEPPKTAGTINN